MTEMTENSSSTEELTAGAMGAEPAGEASAAEPDVASPEAPAAPLPTTTTTVPAGYTILYFDGKTESGPRRGYQIDGEEAVSVTTVLGCLDKPALPWWGMKVGANGVMELVKRGFLTPATHPIENHPTLAWMAPDGQFYVATEEMLVKLLTQEKLTTNHVRDDAAVRGQNAHDAFEAWAAIGEVPDPDDYPLHERGYVQALVNFIRDADGGFNAESQEIVVGSKEHLFAGRYDVRGSTTKEMRLVQSALTQKGEIRKKGPKWMTVPGGLKLLGDVKTSKGVYGSHLLQLEGYEGASIECGYDATDARFVLHLTALGVYEFKRARASYEDFLAILQTYHAVEQTEAALKA